MFTKLALTGGKRKKPEMSDIFIFFAKKIETNFKKKDEDESIQGQNIQATRIHGQCLR